MPNDDLEFDPNKQQTNIKKHDGIDFAEADSVLDDPYALTADEYGDHAEPRYVTIGMSNQGRLLVVIWTIRGDNIRPISARLAQPNQRTRYEKYRR